MMTSAACTFAARGGTLLRPVYTLEAHQWLPVPLEETFAFFARPQNLPRITPPSLALRILTPEPIVMASGLTIDYTVRTLGLRCRWRARVTDYDPPRGFRDVQVVGPYRRWEHWHRFRPENGGTVVEDRVLYELPGGPVTALLNVLLVRPQLRAIFAYRRRRIETLLVRP